MTPKRPRIVSWFSCGTASAVHTKLVLQHYGATHDVAIARCVVPEEHPDNDRFARECERWFGQPVLNLRSTEYVNCEDVWQRTRYMAGIGGARCTIEMKKAVRWQFETDWNPDLQAFGFTVDEAHRADRFRQQNPHTALVTLLVERRLSKPDCHAIIRGAGIEIPAMYRLGFANANCIGCVKAQNAGYWNRVRVHFPAVFKARAELSRELGVRLLKKPTGKRERYFLDELLPEQGAGEIDPPAECSLLCTIEPDFELVEQLMAEIDAVFGAV